MEQSDELIVKHILSKVLCLCFKKFSGICLDFCMVYARLHFSHLKMIKNCFSSNQVQLILKENIRPPSSLVADM